MIKQKTFIFLLLLASFHASAYKMAPTYKGLELTFAMIKPDAIKAKHSDEIIIHIKEHGFKIIRAYKAVFTKQTAELFYQEHKGKPFFENLIVYITSGPVINMVLAKEKNTVIDWRKLMGATDPLKADDGTIRKLFGTNITENATHGSDSPETARRELEFFFPELVK